MSVKNMLFLVTILTLLSATFAQDEKDRDSLSPLTFEKIMRDPKWIGTSPRNITWSEDSQWIYFYWNPENTESDSLYVVSRKGGTPRKVTLAERKKLPALRGHYNRTKTKKVYEKNGDIFLLDIKTGQIQQVTNTVDRESNPRFTHKEKKISFLRDTNLYFWHMDNGQIMQLTDFRKGKKKAEKRVRNIQPSPDEHYITFTLIKQPRDAKQTIVPNYVHESGFSEDIQARTKVGSPQDIYEFGIYDIQRDTVIFVSTEDIPGINDEPSYKRAYKKKVKDEGKQKEDESKKSKKDKKQKPRNVMITPPVWSDDGQNAAVTVLALDHKDRWIMVLEPDSAKLVLIDRQHDEAWIGGPGMWSWWRGGASVGWMPDNRRVWFQSEKTGYSHLYTVDIITGEKRPLTSGDFEIYSPQISRDKKYWYFTSNWVDPGERHFYRMPINGGKAIQITRLTGSNQVTLSPDEKMLAIRYSYSNRPWELYVMNNKGGAKPLQITHSLSEEFTSYPWRDPEVLTFTARDSARVYARLYRPENPESKGPAVIFVHGAGYLQNVHKWWSSYYREYMFHNLLADNGYTVLDIDYRASSGYGRDWRTGIYRFMGGKDLTDQVDGAKFLVDNYDVDPKRIGIYGGSYGGFITLMAMFTEPDVFAAGAALRPVTDWAHYNHGYTSNILNVPYADSIAYVRSSPIYHAEGLKGALLMCHGMVDVNVHFQDVVRLSQRLIELGKENWELAVYPVEGHGFREPSSWTDEYKRIFKLFEQNLK